MNASETVPNEYVKIRPLRDWNASFHSQTVRMGERQNKTFKGLKLQRPVKCMVFIRRQNKTFKGLKRILWEPGSSGAGGQNKTFKGLKLLCFCTVLWAESRQNKTFKGLKPAYHNKRKGRRYCQNKTFKGLKLRMVAFQVFVQLCQNKTFKGLKHGFTIWVNRDLFLVKIRPLRDWNAETKLLQLPGTKSQNKTFKGLKQKWSGNPPLENTTSK